MIIRLKRSKSLVLLLLVLLISLSACAGTADKEKNAAATDAVTQTHKADQDHDATEEKMIETYINKLRDPFILEHNGRYYAYGTGWQCYCTANSALDGTWLSLGCVVNTPEDAQKDYWAPEVYKYNGEFYMFTTYYSSKTAHRGCAVFKSSVPEGPFTIVSDGHVTPSDWDAIDGSLYIDADGQPWMVFVHEWTSMHDSIGAMAAAKMSDDLTHFISEPIQLFLASDAPWAKSGVTDGCFIYECENGELVMLWSSFDTHGYAVGIARSGNGKIDGKWSQDAEPLYSKKIYGGYDGGHPMVFSALNGQKYLAIHSPNTADGVRKEKPVFIPFYEENGRITIVVK